MVNFNCSTQQSCENQTDPLNVIWERNNTSCSLTLLQLEVFCDFKLAPQGGVNTPTAIPKQALHQKNRNLGKITN